ncbi:MAG: hypothetical protein IK081_11230 [Lachnospiraceae bacterium]|nr:hypothetical protein [Lachnospiraceae bacterium]
MRDVKIFVSISIPIIGDESISKLHPPVGFNYQKIPFEKYSYKNCLINGNNEVIVDFENAIHETDNVRYVITLELEEVVSANYNSLAIEERFLDHEVLQEIYNSTKERYEKELHQYFSLIHMYKEGEVARKFSFYSFKTQEGCFKKTSLVITNNVDMVTLILHPMIIAQEEMDCMNSFLALDFPVYSLLKEVLFDDLEYTYHVLDNTTNFKNLVTVLEVLFLRGDNGSKKEMLAKRIALLLESDDSGIISTYNKVKRIYVDRSDAVHDGICTNISRGALDDLRNLIRIIGRKYISYIQRLLQSAPNMTFQEAKDKLVDDLMNKVAKKNSEGIFLESNS